MTQVAPFHSTKTKDVHHVCIRCTEGSTEGNNIETQYRKDGTGGLPLCNSCKDLQGSGKC
jgi:hypothetical protein